MCDNWSGVLSDTSAVFLPVIRDLSQFADLSQLAERIVAIGEKNYHFWCIESLLLDGKNYHFWCKELLLLVERIVAIGGKNYHYWCKEFLLLVGGTVSSDFIANSMLVTGPCPFH